jgi:hypothetical protein
MRVLTPTSIDPRVGSSSPTLLHHLAVQSTRATNSPHSVSRVYLAAPHHLARFMSFRTDFPSAWKQIVCTTVLWVCTCLLCETRVGDIRVASLLACSVRSGGSFPLCPIAISSGAIDLETNMVISPMRYFHRELFKWSFKRCSRAVCSCFLCTSW